MLESSTIEGDRLVYEIDESLVIPVYYPAGLTDIMGRATINGLRKLVANKNAEGNLIEFPPAAMDFNSLHVELDDGAEVYVHKDGEVELEFWEPGARSSMSHCFTLQEIEELAITARWWMEKKKEV